MKETLHSMSEHAAAISEALDNAQRARNHLASLVASWDECDDAERRSEVAIAVERLTPQKERA